MSNFLKYLPNFPAFNWSQEVLQPILLRVRLKQGQLLEMAQSLPIEFRELVNDEMIKKETNGHIFIENGTNFPENEAKVAIFLQNELRQQYQHTLTKERLFELHQDLSILFGQNIDNQYVLDKEAEQLLNQFLVWFNKPGLDRLLKAAIAHLWFLAISPFEKHSSNLAAIISDIQLSKADGTALKYYSFSSQIASESDHYKFILSQAQKGSLDITIWLQWFLGCLENAYDSAVLGLTPIMEKANFLNAPSPIQFNRRQQKIIEKLLLGELNELTTTTYAIFVSCSRDTALRDVTDLIQKGALKKTGGAGKNTRYIL